MHGNSLFFDDVLVLRVLISLAQPQQAQNHRDICILMKSPIKLVQEKNCQKVFLFLQDAQSIPSGLESPRIEPILRHLKERVLGPDWRSSNVANSNCRGQKNHTSRYNFPSNVILEIQGLTTVLQSRSKRLVSQLAQ